MSSDFGGQGVPEEGWTLHRDPELTFLCIMDESVSADLCRLSQLIPAES